MYVQYSVQYVIETLPYPVAWVKAQKEFGGRIKNMFFICS